MLRHFSATAIFLLAACGGSGADSGITTPPPLPPKPDPYITIWLRHMMDTTTAAGRAHWAFYGLYTGPYTNLNGITHQGAISIQDVRFKHTQLCPSFSADSVGQRLVELVGFADTTTDALTAQTAFDAIAARWYSGDHALPKGWDALTTGARDAWLSTQYDAGKGLSKTDPIRWGFDLTGSGQSSFYERTDQDPSCAVI